jgi:hypothetical protein
VGYCIWALRVKHTIVVFLLYKRETTVIGPGDDVVIPGDDVVIPGDDVVIPRYDVVIPGDDVVICFVSD